jgi:hypothetical protein
MSFFSLECLSVSCLSCLKVGTLRGRYLQSDHVCGGLEHDKLTNTVERESISTSVSEIRLTHDVIIYEGVSQLYGSKTGL